MQLASCITWSLDLHLRFSHHCRGVGGTTHTCALAGFWEGSERLWDGFGGEGGGGEEGRNCLDAAFLNLNFGNVEVSFVFTR